MRRWASTMLVVLASLSAPAVRAQSGGTATFSRVNAPGFGDSQNMYAWSMAWFKGKLYVGTGRNTQCVELATIQFYFPNSHSYPPPPGGCPTCPPNEYDINLQAEVWAYTPQANTWARVFQSPNDLANPKAPGKNVARDIGFRGMIVYTESDGTEALYVAGVSAREYIPGLPLPRLLRSVDGVNFTPITLNVPNLPPSVMGMRAMAAFNGKLYVTASTELAGEGVIIESSSPASGNFRVVTPPSLLAYDLEPFNGQLYIGAADKVLGYSIWRTSAVGTPPYALTPVVTNGAGRGKTVASVVAMHVFKNRLYASAAGYLVPLAPCELIRVNPDNSWDVVAGNPRVDPVTHRYKYPISSLPDGFGNPFNAHIWRLEDDQTRLYAGTNDVSFFYAKLAPFFPGIAARYGFDLYSTSDGVYWSTITQNGFGSPSSFGVRTMAATPAGLFVGSTNSCIGTEVFVNRPAGGAAAHADPPAAVAVAPAGVRQRTAKAARANDGPPPPAPARLEAELHPEGVLLTWDPSPGATAYQVLRAPFRQTAAFAHGDDDEPAAWFSVPDLVQRIGTSRQTFFHDPAAEHGSRYLYQVQAVDASGKLSPPSNQIVVSADTVPAATFGGVSEALRDIGGHDETDPATLRRLRALLNTSMAATAEGNLPGARRALEALRGQAARSASTTLSDHDAEDLRLVVVKLLRRVRLVEAQLLPGTALLPVP